MFGEFPDFEVAVAGRDDFEDAGFFVPGDEADFADGGLVPAVEAFGDAEQDAELADDLPGRFVEGGEFGVFRPGKGLVVVEGEVGDDFDFALVKAEQFGVHDEVIGVEAVVVV